MSFYFIKYINFGVVYTLDCCICSHVAGYMFFLWKRFEEKKKKKKRRERNTKYSPAMFWVWKGKCPSDIKVFHQDGGNNLAQVI